jgi:hypothetical protein
MGEGLGVATENDGDVAQVAVDADAIFGGDHEIAGRRALLLGTVLGIGADVDDFLGIAEIVFEAVALVERIVEVADDCAEVFAGGDSAPAADGVEADGNRAFGKQRRSFVADDRSRGGRCRGRRRDAVGARLPSLRARLAVANSYAPMTCSGRKSREPRP